MKISFMTLYAYILTYVMFIVNLLYLLLNVKIVDYMVKDKETKNSIEGSKCFVRIIKYKGVYK